MKAFERIVNFYTKAFSIDEFANSDRLKLVWGLSWFLTIFDFTNVSQKIADKNFQCWPHFSNCYILNDYILPKSFAFSFGMTFVLTLLFLTAYFFFKKKWSCAHFFFFIVVLVKLVLFFFVANFQVTNFELFYLLPTLTLLISKNKVTSLRFIYAFVYFFTARVKFDDGWILGTYFTSTKSGLPLVSDKFVPIFTNAVIILEMILSVGLIYPIRRLRKISLSFWTVFHLYSAIIVDYFYPVRCMFFLWSIFGMAENEKDNSIDGKLIGKSTGIFALFFLALNLYPNYISKNPNDTHEGRDYSFHMINSNYQCESVVSTLDENNNIINERFWISTHPMNRCRIYGTFAEIKEKCKTLLPLQTISWKLNQSRNGGPFYQIINVKNACELTYNFFSHNEWIKYPSESIIVGYPEKNDFGSRKLKKRIQMRSGPINQDVPLILKDNFFLIKKIYVLIWMILLQFFSLILVFSFFTEYKLIAGINKYYKSMIDDKES